MKKREKPSRREKNEKKKSRRGFVWFLICAFVLCIAVNVALSYGDRLDTMIVRTGTQEELVEAEGYLFMEQTLVNAPASGYLYCEADEDQRVKLGETVAHIYKNEINTSAGNELKTVEEEIKRISENTLKSDIYSGDGTRIEQSIAEKLRRIPQLGYENNIEGAAEIKKEVDELIEGRRIIKGDAEPKDSSAELDALRKRKAELEAQYNLEKTAVYAPKAGAFTARVNGLEDMLGLTALQKISVDYIKELDKKTAAVKTETKVESGQAVGKIVNNFEWSVAAVISADVAEDMDVGDSVDIRFTDIGIETVQGTVSKITAEDGGKVVLVVDSNKYVDGIYSASKVNVEFVKHHYEGFKIPTESIRMVENRTGVYVIRNDKARFLPVDIVYNNKKWAIVSESVNDGSTIKLYDELIVSGKNLYDDKVVR